MPPGPHDEMIAAGLAFRFQSEIAMNSAPHVLLVPQTLDPHGGHFRRVLCDQRVESLPLPERVVRWVLHHLADPWQLIDSMRPGIVTGRACAQEILVVVVPLAEYAVTFVLTHGLARSVVEIGLTECAVVEPIV